jgi:hypothetical protein
MKMTHIESDALYWASCNNLEFRVPGRAVLDICKSGSNDAAVDAHLDEVQRLTNELYKTNRSNPWRPTSESIREELYEHGAWDDSELADDKANWARLLWIAAWNIYEDEERDYTAPVFFNEEMESIAA